MLREFVRRPIAATGPSGAALLVLLVLGAGSARAVPTSVLISGEVEKLTVDNPADHWSGGRIVVGGQEIILPRNLLVDLPANRLSLQQIFAQAPASCIDTGESGLAKSDLCNLTKTGGFAAVHANHTNGGNVIAGDLFLQKGTEALAGVVSYINYADGYFRLNGIPGDAATGVMVRLNDPGSRHTVQTGLGCAGGPNCSPDPRFTLDADNYTNAYSTGYPYCLPSSVPRTFVDALDFDGDANTTETLTSAAQPNGTGDVLCPETNRTGAFAADSRRFAPLQLGDHLTAEGNFETVAGAHFLSAHSSKVSRAVLTTRGANQPDYLFLEEVEIDAAGFENARVRTLYIGFSSDPAADVLIWSLHRDPGTNEAHELPLATTVGCDAAGGAQTCVFAPHMWKIRHDVDFQKQPTQPRLSPCAHLRADPRFAAQNPCPQGGTLAEDFSVLVPMPHEIQSRTGRKVADLARVGGPVLRTLDVNGAEATNGQYLFPFGLGLGGIAFPEFGEINIDALQTPYIFEGLTWNLDRRLGPGGCDGPCDATPQPLDPFPFSGLDPRTRAALPTGPVTDPVFTASPLANATNRVFSFISPTLGNFDGDNTLAPFPPADPPAFPILPTPEVLLACVQPADLVPPTAPQGLVATAAGTSQINLAWTAATDDVGVVGYDVLRDGATIPIATVTGTTFSDTGLAAASTHTYVVVARDAAGNPSPPTEIATATTDPAAPLAGLTGFTPVAGAVGTVVQLLGDGLAGATAVRFGGVSATTFANVDGTRVDAVVPTGALSGVIEVVVAAGTFTSTGSFSVQAAPPPPPAAPVVSSFSPVSGAVGASVTIAGTGFTGATAVFFNATGATTFTVVSDTQITAQVPAGATTGSVFVALPTAFVGSATSFQVTAPPPPPPPPQPALTSFAPASGPVGTTVTINGVGFTGTSAVFFGATAATTFLVVSDLQLTAVVPAGATTGIISVAVPTAFVTSASAFTVTTLGPPPPTPAPGAIVFSDNFDLCTTNPGLGPNWTVSGLFYCGGARARGEVAGGTAVVNAPVPADVTVDARVRLTSTNMESGVLARLSGGAFYSARITDTGRVRIVRKDAAGTTVLADQPAAGFVAGSTNTLRLRVHGTTVVQLEASLNGSVVASATDSSVARLTSGAVGLYSGSVQRTQFDDFVVRSP